MVTPYVRRHRRSRRLRLGADMRAIRAAAGLTAAQRGKRIGRFDTVTAELILSEPDDFAPYGQLYERLREAALPAADRLELVTAAAAELPDE